MEAIFFATPKEFRVWLENNHLKETELVVGYYKVSTKKESMTWSESVDEALCFGWIDGVRKSIDAARYCIRFTPRKKNSIWSAVNIKKVEELRKNGRMLPEGEKAFALRTEDKSGIYSHETESVALAAQYENQFKKNILAWDFFKQQPPSYRKVMVHWIMSAKQEKTRQSRLDKLIIESEQLKRIRLF
ncbi:YdeI/OmpD-associated family protein [Paenimyroides ceti]